MVGWLVALVSNERVLMMCATDKPISLWTITMRMTAKLTTRDGLFSGYIDVSKRQVEEEEEKQACEQRYVRGKLVGLRHTVFVCTRIKICARSAGVFVL